MSTLAERLQTALDRKTEGTQADLAKFCGVSAPSVSNWFTGETKSLKAGSLRKAAEYLGCSRDWLETGAGLPGWVANQSHTTIGASSGTTPGTANPLGMGVAHPANLYKFTVAPLFTSGEIMSGKDLSAEFRFELTDDAMAPAHPRGLHILFSTTRATTVGRLVLIQVGGQLHVRQYAQGDTAGHWRAVPAPGRESVYRSFDSALDAPVIRGVYRGVYETGD